MNIIWIIAALLVGLAAGGVIMYVTMRRRYGDREAVAELRAEFDQYKAQVTEHFVETADLVNTLTRTYKNVFDHLETGAYRLVGEETLRQQLDTVDEAPVLIEYIGQRRTESEEHAEEPVAEARPEPTSRPATPAPLADETDDEAPSSEDESAPPAKPPRT